jgi:Flp pilus assembly protein protease CpaA
MTFFLYLICGLIVGGIFDLVLKFRPQWISRNIVIPNGVEFCGNDSNSTIEQLNISNAIPYTTLIAVLSAGIYGMYKFDIAVINPSLSSGPAILVTLLLLSVITVTDQQYEIIPDRVLLLGLVCGIIVMYVKFITGSSIEWLSILLLPVILLVLRYVPTYFNKGYGVGIGDLKLSFILAILLGWKALEIMYLAALLAGVMFIFMRFLFQHKEKRRVAMGPYFLTTAWLLCLIDPLGWYFTIIGIDTL